MKHGKHSLLLRIAGCLAVVTLFTGAATAFAQEGQDLPDLAPRDVEIRGELTIRFPSLRRQPLVGFNPPPTVPEIPASRRPYAEPYKQRRADLPESPLRAPRAPSALPRDLSDAFRGRIETGAGRFLSRYAVMETAVPFSDHSRWTLRADYAGRNGYAPFGVEAGRDGGRLASTWTTRYRAGTLDLGVDGSLYDYAMYGLAGGTAGLVHTAPSRRRTDGSVSIGWTSAERSRYLLKVDGSLFGGRTKSSLFDPSVRVDPRAERSDAGIAGSVRFETRGSLAGFVDASGSQTGTGAGSAFGPDAVGARAGGGLAFRIGRRTRVRLGGDVLAVTSSTDATSLPARRLIYGAPRVELTTELAPNVLLELRQTPSVESFRAGNLLAESPFVGDAYWMEPVMHTVDARAVVRTFWSRWSLTGQVTYRQSPNRRFFEFDPTPFSGHTAGVVQIRHSAARTMSAGLDVQTVLSSGIEWQTGFRLQDGRLTDLDAAIPYFPRWTARTMISAPFASSRGLVQLTGSLLAARERDRSGTVDVPLVADLDARIQYRIVRNLSVVMAARNLSSRGEYWERYLEPPFEVTGGLAWRW